MEDAWRPDLRTIAAKEEAQNAMGTVSIRLLGGFDVSCDGAPVIEFESDSARALLARLGAEPGVALSRAMLAELLWPERPPGSAAGNLRHTLSALRRTLGDDDSDRPLLVATRSTIMLDDRVDVDLPTFRRRLSVPPSEPGAVAAWESGIALRRGPLLDGFDPPLSEEWETWLRSERSDVDDLAGTTLRRLVELRERTGEHEVALDHVRSWIDIDPWSEEAHRALMRLLALADRRAEALTHATELEASLQSELGIEPNDRTRRLIDDIRHDRFPIRVHGVPDLPPRPPASSVPEPCIGRDDERHWLRSQLDDTQVGAGRMIVIVGQPGSGKTVLLERFARDAHEALPDLIVLRGVCNQHRGLTPDPFLPLRQVLGQLLGDVELSWLRGHLTAREIEKRWLGLPTAVETLLDRGPSLLGTIVDAEALARRLDVAHPGHEVSARLRRAAALAARRTDDPTRQARPLIEQCTQVLTTMAATTPIMIEIDDLQWADPATTAVLTHLAATLGRVPLLVVVAMRPGELGVNGRGPVATAVDEILGRAPTNARLELEGTRAFVDACLDAEPNAIGEGFRANLHRTTGGNALFTVEVIDMLRSNGQLRRNDSGTWVASEPVAWDRVSPRIGATIATRLSALPAETRADLEVASLQGLQFSAEVVARARDAPTHDVMLRLSDLGSAPSSLIRFIGSEVVDGVRLDHFEFRHALFRHHLAEHVAPAPRRHHHEAIGRALETIHAGEPGRVAADLALHFDAASLDPEAIRYHAAAGRNAARLSAYDEAALHLRRALALLERTVPSPERLERELALLTSLGACLQARRGYNAPETTEVYERLRALTREAVPSIESANAIGGLATVDGLRAEYLDAIAEAEQLLDLAAELASPPIEAVARLHLGWLLLMVGRIVEADEQLTLSHERYDPSWDDWLTSLIGVHVPSTIAAWHAIVAWHLGHDAHVEERADRSIELARAAGFPFALAFSLAVAGCLVGEFIDDEPRVRAAATELAEVAEAEDLAFYQAAAITHAGTARFMAGDPAGAVDGLREGLARWTSLGTEAFVTWIRTWLVEALVDGGDLEAARDELAEIDRRLAHGEEHLTELRRRYVEGLLHRRAGDLERARQTFIELVDMARAARAKGPEDQALRALDELAASRHP